MLMKSDNITKPIRRAIVEELQMYWAWEAINEEGLPRYQLRADTGQTEQGTRLSRRLWMNDGEHRAKRVHMDIRDEGIPIYTDWAAAPLRGPCVIGSPEAARQEAKERGRRNM